MKELAEACGYYYEAWNEFNHIVKAVPQNTSLIEAYDKKLCIAKGTLVSCLFQAEMVRELFVHRHLCEIATAPPNMQVFTREELGIMGDTVYDLLERFVDCRCMRVDLFQKKYPDAPPAHTSEFDTWLTQPARNALIKIGRKGD